MNVMQTYPDGARKLCHLPRGMVFVPECNDGTIHDTVYMTGAKSTSNMREVVNLKTGIPSCMSVSTRTTEYPDATVILKPNIEKS